MAEDARVERNGEKYRYELLVDGTVAGFAQFHESGNRVVFTHSEVHDAYAGHGLGKVLAAGALDDVVAQGKVIVPLCPVHRRLPAQEPRRVRGSRRGAVRAGRAMSR